MTVFGRGIALALGACALCFAGAAGAQENLDQGKSPAQLYASDCAICHKSPQGLAKTGGLFGVETFLRSHYTASRESAAAIAKYLEAAGSAPSAAPAKKTTKRAAKGDEKGGEKGKAGEKKPDGGIALPGDNKPVESKPSEPKASESKPAEAKPAESKPAEAKPAEPKVEAKPAEPPESKPAQSPKAD